ncbi:gp53-like domain-containing protein [Citrobacter freundii]|uniref:gp53-like domain-containing protein n=1 Tax=Citrobacter freundii TaxID=546 RepID=UPI0028BD8179|nr:hypothetical protein [Citrobacter freundii]MDT7444990.1 hypothetical protein [Citrobacter freundii]
MAINNFKPFATAVNANVTAQADWETLPALLSGFMAGKASSAQVNKAIRQASFIAAALAQYTANKSGLDVLDDGDLNGFITKMSSAFGKDYQALDATLTALAGLATGANKLPYFTGNDTAAQTDLTSVGRDIIGKNTIADILTYLGLGAAAKSGVVQTTGQSATDVISQKGATDNFALKALLDNFGGATLLFNKSRNYSLQLSDAGALSLYSQVLDKIVMAWSPSGELLTGTVGFEHVKELKSAAKKDVGNGAGQIPDMSFFPLSGMGTDNLIAKLPNGIIIQVFRRTVSNSSTVGVPVVTSATYPTPFPSGLWGVFATKSTYAQVSVSCESATSTGFDIATVLNTGTGGSTLSSAYFIALGY